MRKKELIAVEDILWMKRIKIFDESASEKVKLHYGIYDHLCQKFSRLSAILQSQQVCTVSHPRSEADKDDQIALPHFSLTQGIIKGKGYRCS